LSLNGANTTNNTSVTVRNDADINNRLTVNANTGNNNVEGNTGTSGLETGKIDIEGAITNIANVSNPMVYVVNVFGHFIGNILDAITAPAGATVIVNEINDETGPGAEATNDVNNNQTTDITQINNARANNNIVINANTGKNRIEDNTEVGKIKTGSINVLSNITNIMNTSIDKLTIGVINIFGNWRARGKNTTAQNTGSNSNPAETNNNLNTNTTSDEAGSTKEALNGSSGQSSGHNLLEKIVKKSNGKTSEEKESGSDQINQLNGDNSDNVIVQAYSTGSETAKTVSKQLLYLMFAGCTIFLLWLVTEMVTARIKKGSR
jgi:hypothetical protein